MRDGVNPEKFKKEKNKRYSHRIVMPVYIPNITQEYYKNMPQVLAYCLDSLIKSINPETTAITIINNNSTPEISKIINSRASSFDKVITYAENKGKVCPLIHEARGCYEPFITFTDNDVFFVEGWELAVFSIFKAYKKAGVVAPLPSPGLAFNHNNSLFFDAAITRKMGYSKIIDDADADLYLEGLGNQSLLNRNNRSKSWREAHYYLKKQPKAIVGAGHFVATYRANIFKSEDSFPDEKFKKAYEDLFIDCLSDKNGFYRLSTVNTFAYHMGTQLDKNVDALKKIEGSLIKTEFFEQISLKPLKRLSPYFLRWFVFKILKKVKKL
jgi:hypothetical protein